MTRDDLRVTAADLAPGDHRAADFGWSRFELERVTSLGHPLFERCYQRLWREFGQLGEMERREVIEQRFGWRDRLQADASGLPTARLLYEMLAVLDGDQLIAVRDHTAVVSPDAATAAVVHLSHVIVEPTWRGTGLAGWLRALPIAAARQCAERGGWAHPPRITLAAEMEHPGDRTDAARMARLRAYEKAGFAKVDPSVVPYCQPDFRAPEQIERTGVASIPLALIVRRVGYETDSSISGAELRALVGALYEMYARTCVARHMDDLWQALARYPEPQAQIALVPPTD